jgi:hypothetical protein
MAPKALRPPTIDISKDLKFESNWCSVGIVRSDETPVAKFPFKNVSAHSVTLAEFQLADFLHLKTQQMEYKPGESGTLEIEVDTASLGITTEESFSQSVVLKTEPGGAYVILTIAARIVPAPEPPAKP